MRPLRVPLPLRLFTLSVFTSAIVLVQLASRPAASNASTRSATADPAAASNPQPALSGLEPRSLDGARNNSGHSDWGQTGTEFSRVAAAAYGDGVSAIADGPPARRISNRVFNDVGQNIFSENDISQWGWAWGQFLDHDLDLRDETPAEPAPMEFDSTDALEQFSNDSGGIAFARTPPRPQRERAARIPASSSTHRAASSTPARCTGRPSRGSTGSRRRTASTCCSRAATCRTRRPSPAHPRWT
jgi:Animal haem peroxidase